MIDKNIFLFKVAKIHYINFDQTKGDQYNVFRQISIFTTYFIFTQI